MTLTALPTCLASWFAAASFRGFLAGRDSAFVAFLLVVLTPSPAFILRFNFAVIIDTEKGHELGLGSRLAALCGQNHLRAHSSA